MTMSAAEKKTKYATYYQANRERIRAQQAGYQRDHREEITERHKLYVENNKLRVAERQSAYYQSHKDESLAYHKKYYMDHKEEIKIKAHEYNEIHKEERRLYVAKYYREHRDQCAARNALYNKTHKEERAKYAKEYRQEQGVEVIKKYRKTNKRRKAAYDAEWHMANREKELARMSEYGRAHPLEASMRAAKRRALKVNAIVSEDKEKIAAIYKRAGSAEKVRCYLCHKLIPLGHRHVDHIRPLTKSGAHSARNLAIACDICNDRKYNKTMVEMGLLV